MSVFKRKRQGKEIYEYDFIISGHRFSGSTGAKNKTDAKRFEDDLKKAKAKEIETAKAFTASGPMTLQIAASRYWIEKGQHLKNDKDALRYLAWLEAHFGKTQRLDTITDSAVAEMVAKRRGEGAQRGKALSNATVNRSATVPLREIMIRARKVWKVPAAEIDWSLHMLKEPKERVREATRDEETKLLNAMRDDYAPAVRFAILTGCRRAEIVGLMWPHVDWFNQSFTVTGKGDKSRTVPMSAAVHDLLWSLKDNHPTAVFTYVVKNVWPAPLASRLRQALFGRAQTYPA